MVHHGDICGYGLGAPERSPFFPSNITEMPAELAIRRYRMGLLGNLSAAPEGTPEPLGYATIESILAFHDLGEGNHPCIPGNGCADSYRHGT